MANNTEDVRLIKGDCLEVMDKLIADDIKVDAILTDPPYGTTACKWDSVIPFEPMWERLHKLVKDNGAIVLFGSEPFSSALRMSNIKRYKYDWVWDKRKSGNPFLAKKQPMKCHELISVFNSNIYIPQMSDGDAYKQRSSKHTNRSDGTHGAGLRIRYAKDHDPSKRYPRSIMTFKNHNQGINRHHPTQKPVALMEYLIKTYTHEGETVLDFTMGSGSTGVAAVNTGRNFIGIELDDKYFEIAKERIVKDSETVMLLRDWSE